MAQRPINVIGSNEVAVQVTPTADRTIALPDANGTLALTGQVPGAIAAGGVTASTGTIQFANSNGITFGLSNGTVTASYTVPTQTTEPMVALADSANTITNQTVVFANSNGVSWGLNGSTMTASVAAGGGINLADSAQTATSGMVQFSNSNNISFGMSGTSQMTASVSQSQPTLSYWNLMYGGYQARAVTFGDGLIRNKPEFFPLMPGNAGLLFPGNVTLNTLMIMMQNTSLTATSNSGAFTYSISLGLYSVGGSSSYNLLNSCSTSIGSGANNASFSSVFGGQRWLTIHSSQWSAQPVLSQGPIYLLALMVATAGSDYNFNYIMWTPNDFGGSSLFGTIGVGQSASLSNQGLNPFYGYYSVTTAALPAVIDPTNQTRNGSQNARVPWIAFNALASSF